MPVDNVGFVPDFEIPGAHFFGAVALHQVGHVIADQVAPHAIIPRRIIHRAAHRRSRVVELVFGDSRHARGQVPGHETKLDKWAHTGLFVGVEGAVGDRKVVNRLAVRPNPEDVRRTPLQLRHSVARGQQVVRADVDGRGTHVVKLAQQLLSVRHGSIIRLVEAEPVGDGLKCAHGPRKINLDGHGRRRNGHGGRVQRPSCGNGADRQQQPCQSTHDRGPFNSPAAPASCACPALPAPALGPARSARTAPTGGRTSPPPSCTRTR